MTTAPTQEAPTTSGGRPKPAKLDKARIAETAASQVVATLESIQDDERRLKKATEIIDQANGFLADNEPRMRKMALYLALIEGGVAVHNATSMSRYAFYKLTVDTLGADWPRPVSWDETVAERARKRGVRNYRTAAFDLPPLATQVIEAHARKDVALRYRDELILKLVDEGMSHAAIGNLIGRERSRVTQIVSAAGAKAGGE